MSDSEQITLYQLKIFILGISPMIWRRIKVRSDSTMGNYPESIHVDQIYRTQENQAWCKERGIRVTGVPLGRPPKIIDKEAKKQAQLDERFRSRIEGKFGEAKRRFSLNRVMTKLSEISQTAIAIIFLMMNLSTLLRQFCAFSCLYLRIDTFSVIQHFRLLRGTIAAISKPVS